MKKSSVHTTFEGFNSDKEDRKLKEINDLINKLKAFFSDIQFVDNTDKWDEYSLVYFTFSDGIKSCNIYCKTASPRDFTKGSISYLELKTGDPVQVDLNYCNLDDYSETINMLKFILDACENQKEFSYHRFKRIPCIGDGYIRWARN